MKTELRNTLKKIIREEIHRQIKGRVDENANPKQMRNEFIQACKNYGNYRNSFADANNIKNTIGEIGRMVEMAENVTLSETQDWFDNVTVSRHMKQLKEAYKVMEKTGGELVQVQQRFNSAYEDIGEIFSKYYDV